MADENKSLLGDEELDELLELTDDEVALVEEGVTGAAPTEVADDEAQASGADAEKSEAEAGAEPTESATEGEAPASQEPEAKSDGERGVDEAQQREIDGLKRDLFRERERRRAAEDTMRAQAAKEQPQPEPAILTDDDYTTDDEGRVVVKPEAIARIAAAQPQPEATTQQLFAQQYTEMRRGFVDSFAPGDERAAADRAAQDMEDAYLWLDQRLVKARNEGDYGDDLQIRSIGQLRRFMDAEGVSKEFEERYPGVSVEEMMFGSSDPYLYDKTLRAYMAGKAEASEETEEEPKKEEAEAATEKADAERTLPLGQRPRSMAGRGTGANAGKKTAAQFAEMDSEDLFDMSDEEFNEMNAAARAQTQ